MTAEEFIIGLTARFKDKKDDERNKTFYEDLTYFANACPEIHLQDVYDWVRINHKFSTPFLLYKIYDYAIGKGYIQQKQKGNDVSWLTCVKCGTHYSMIGRGCPECREKKATTWHGETYPDNYVNVTEDCYWCTIYPEIKKHNKWMTFKDCNDYGKKQDASCGPCQCKECCRQMMLYNSDPHSTVEKYRTKKLAQPWMIQCDPINETIQNMVNDIARRGI